MTHGGQTRMPSRPLRFSGPSERTRRHRVKWRERFFTSYTQRYCKVTSFLKRMGRCNRLSCHALRSRHSQIEINCATCSQLTFRIRATQLSLTLRLCLYVFAIDICIRRRYRKFCWPQKMAGEQHCSVRERGRCWYCTSTAGIQ